MLTSDAVEDDQSDLVCGADRDELGFADRHSPRHLDVGGDKGEGGMKKSSVLTPSPNAVVTEIRPDVALLGTLVESEVVVAAVMVARVR